MKQCIKSRLARRIAFWVLVSIIAIEAVIVIPSYFTRQYVLLLQLEELGRSTVLPVANLMRSGAIDGDLPALLGDMTIGTVVVGGVVYTPEGRPMVEFGELPMLTADDMDGNSMKRRRSASGQRYDVLWSADELNTDYHVVARLDASGVARELTDYTWRMIGFVLIISAFVTGAAMVAVATTTITPILALREGLLSFGEGKRFADTAPLPEHRNDELGEVMAAFEVMARSIEERTADLQTANQRLQSLNDRLQGELALARRIQRSLLPPTAPGWAEPPDIRCYTNPASAVGGDFYTYDHLTDDSYIIAVGDVSGKGMPAAMLMAISVASFHSATGRASGPNDLLVQLDQMIAPYTHSTHQNCALVYALVGKSEPPDRTNGCSSDDGTYTLCVANAGCITPLIRRNGGSVEWVDVGGIPLGVGLGSLSGYQEASCCLARGDLVVMTSDGVVEATSKQHGLFGFERLERAVSTGPTGSAEAMLEYLRNEVASFVGGQEQHDDITIVVIRV